MDLGFEQLLAEHQQEFSEAEVFDNWMPPVGTYVVSITKFDSGQGSKNDMNLLWWKPTCMIEDVQLEINGKTFTIFYSTKACGIFKGAARVISEDATLNDIVEAHKVFEKSVGIVAEVEILITVAKNGKEYKNCYFRRILKTTASSADVDQAPVEGQAVEAPVDAPLPEPVEAPPVV
ncbi:hypothetical protein LCGC14_1012760 [marine sediment metagenome]|uniref:DUF669 domain-containing protein n=1 Tax=marine sediment metagenome TaxID=412755 RepID=A0A0F9NL96_9ZZZZ